MERLRNTWQLLLSALPRGHGLPEREWERRHSGMLLLLWTHAAGIYLYAGLLASWPGANLRFRGICVCLGLLTSSGILVHLSGGLIEMHFHFFVMVPLMALYQDWLTFLAAIAYVVLHHGTVGVLDPGQVYNHARAWESPWTWAAIHGIFVLGTSVVACITWRLNELATGEAAASAQRFGNLVQSLDAIVWEAEPSMERFSFVSRQIEPVFGVSAERWQAEPGLWKRFIHPDDRDQALAAYEAIVDGGTENQVGYRVKTADGRLVHVSDIVHVVRDEQGGAEQLRGVTVNMTERRTLEEQLRQAQKMEAIGRLAGGVAHDFNNLLSVIIGRAELLRDAYPALDRRLSLIASTAMRAAGLTRQLLAFGRQQHLQPRVMDMTSAVQNLVPMLRRLVREDIEMLVEASGIARVEADPVQVDQILLNLVVNAGDAMPRGGRLTIEVATVDLDGRPDGRRVGAPPGPYVALRVADTGTGMEASTLAHIFEPFFTTKEIGRGTGLGLATVYGAVTQSHGDIRVESAPGRGTSFTVYLPRVDAPITLTAPPAVLRDTPRTGTLLLVEDQAEVRALMAEVLVDRGYRVMSAAAAGEALGLAEAMPESIDLLITDIVMPAMNGIVLAERLRDKRPAMKVLYITGYTPEDIDRLGSLRDQSVLEKPFTPNDLTARVRELLG